MKRKPVHVFDSQEQTETFKSSRSHVSYSQNLIEPGTVNTSKNNFSSNYVTPRVIGIEESTSRSLEASVPLPIVRYNFYEKIIANLEHLKVERSKSAKRLSGE